MSRIAAARAVERQVEFMRTRAQRDIALLTASRYELVKQVRDQLASLEATQELTQESLRAQQVAFAAGLATSLDLVDAEQASGSVNAALAQQAKVQHAARVQDLFKDGVVAAQRNDEAETQLKAARLTTEAAKAAYDLAVVRARPTARISGLRAGMTVLLPASALGAPSQRIRN